MNNQMPNDLSIAISDSELKIPLVPHKMTVPHFAVLSFAMDRLVDDELRGRRFTWAGWKKEFLKFMASPFHRQQFDMMTYKDEAAHYLNKPPLDWPCGIFELLSYPGKDFHTEYHGAGCKSEGFPQIQRDAFEVPSESS